MTDSTKTEEKKIEAPNTVDAGTLPAADSPVVRRGRGRPPASSKAGDATNPPLPKAEEIPGDSAKPTAAKPKSRAKKSEVNVSDLAAQIYGMHAMVAMMTGLGELQIHEKEAEALAKAVVGITEQYDFEISGKTGASLQLFAAAAMVYAPRVFAIKARIAQSKQAAQSTLVTDGLPAAPAGDTQFPT